MYLRALEITNLEERRNALLGWLLGLDSETLTILTGLDPGPGGRSKCGFPKGKVSQSSFKKFSACTKFTLLVAAVVGAFAALHSASSTPRAAQTSDTNNDVIVIFFLAR